jgi:hypothetical protein
MKTAWLVCLFSVVAASAAAQERIPTGTKVGNISLSGYDDSGRRDPFVSLMTPKKSVAAQNASRPRAGLSSLSLADVSVKGIVRSGAAVLAVLAVLEGPDGKSFVAHSKDKLQDAMVKSIDAEGVVFVEQQVDAGGAVRSRDIRKPLRPTTEGVR